MKKSFFIFSFSFFILLTTGAADACTNFIITKGASADGTTMVSYAADSHQLYGALYKHNAPAKGHKAGETVDIYEWDTGKFLGRIPQAARTFNTIGNINEHGLIIGETTFVGLDTLQAPNGIIDYGSMIYLTLQRAKTAREAIATIDRLTQTYGYASSGESLSIADPDEAWIMELIGKGVHGKGIVWVARKIPDGMVSAHANQARIGTFPLNDPENCLYSSDVIDFARSLNLYDGTDEAFNFADTYAPLTFIMARGCEARVWSFFRSVADGMDAYLDHAMGYDLKNRLPLWVAPREKIATKTVFDLMRDHFEDTPMDMRKGVGAGGHKLPYRWRPMEFEGTNTTTGETKMYLNERAIATQQTGFWFVGQSRANMPDPLKGVLWFGVDDAATSPLTPIYACSTRVPWCFDEANGSMMEYSAGSMFWLTNRIANFAYLRYDMIGSEIRRRIDSWEESQIYRLPRADSIAAAHLYKSPIKAIKFLTDYSVETAETLFDRWSAFDKYLIVKYMDGNVKRTDETDNFLDNDNGRGVPEMPDFPGYDDTWKNNVATNDDGTLLIPE